MRRGRRTVLTCAVVLLLSLAFGPPTVQAAVSGDGASTTPIGLPTVPLAPGRYTGPAFVVGDSVLLGATTCVSARGWSHDAKGSRQAPAVRDVLAAMGRKVPHLVAVHAGTNGGITDRQIDAIMKVLGARRIVVWVTIQLPDNGRFSHELRTNTAIRHAARRFPNTRLADWNARSAPNLATWTWSDHIHLKPAGCRAYATLIDSVGRAPTDA